MQRISTKGDNVLKDNLVKVGNFFNLLDAEGRLSISNSGVYVLLVKVAMSPTIDWPTAAGLLVTLLNYSHKRMVTAGTVSEIADSTDVPTAK